MSAGVPTKWEFLGVERDMFPVDACTKAAALRVCPSVVSVVSPKFPDEMTSYQGKLIPKRPLNNPFESILWGSGVIIECEDAGDGAYFSTVLTKASCFVRTNGVQPNEIEVKVYLSDSKLYKGEVVACDFHFNLAAIRIVSETPLKPAKLRGLDDVISMDLIEQLRLREDKSFQLRPDSNLYKILPGDKVIALARKYRNTHSLLVACGAFSMESSEFDCKELYKATGIDHEGFQGGPVINYSGEVIGILSCKSAFLPINIVSRWWAHYKNYREFRRPWIGFEVGNLHKAHAQILEQFTQSFHDISSGVVVKKIEENSPAFISGIRPLDVILQCDGTIVRSSLEFFEKIWDKADKSVELSVVRVSNDGRLNLTLAIGETLADKFYRLLFNNFRSFFVANK